MNAYLELLKHVREEGVRKEDRTVTGTLSVFGPQLRFDLRAGFPAVTTKRLHFRSIIHELLWFISGNTNIKYLQDNNVRIWNEWADADGNLGPVYGAQWRTWPTQDGQTIDQLAGAIDMIRHQPDSRRIIVSAWNVGCLQAMALPPCHMLMQFYVAAGQLSCKVYQRSADLFLGVPFNIASYAILTHMIAQVTELEARELILSFGDAHLYLNHLDQADLQLSRNPMPLPSLWLNTNIRDIDAFTYDDIRVENYQHHPTIKAPIAV